MVDYILKNKNNNTIKNKRYPIHILYMLNYRNKEWLYEEYIVKKRSQTEIAKECKVSQITIWRWLKKHNIPSRDVLEGRTISLEKKKKTYWDEKWLRHQYTDLKKSCPQIAKEQGYSVSALRWFMKKFGIKGRLRGAYYTKQFDIPKDWLYEEYITKNRRMKDIAKDIGCKACTIEGRLNEYNIKKDKSLKIGKNHPCWKGGRVERLGYIKIYRPDHPRANKSKYIQEHIVVMEKSIGRYLWKFERVHHINFIKNDNRIENLFLCKGASEHTKINLSIFKIMKELMEKKIILFNREKKRYEVQKERTL